MVEARKPIYTTALRETTRGISAVDTELLGQPVTIKQFEWVSPEEVTKRNIDQFKENWSVFKVAEDLDLSLEAFLAPPRPISTSFDGKNLAVAANSQMSSEIIHLNNYDPNNALTLTDSSNTFFFLLTSELLGHLAQKREVELGKAARNSVVEGIVGRFSSYNFSENASEQQNRLFEFLQNRRDDMEFSVLGAMLSVQLDGRPFYSLPNIVDYEIRRVLSAYSLPAYMEKQKKLFWYTDSIPVSRYAPSPKKNPYAEAAYEILRIGGYLGGEVEDAIRSYLSGDFERVLVRSLPDDPEQMVFYDPSLEREEVITGFEETEVEIEEIVESGEEIELYHGVMRHIQKENRKARLSKKTRVNPRRLED